VKIVGLAFDLLNYTTAPTENGSIEGRYALLILAWLTSGSSTDHMPY